VRGDILGQHKTTGKKLLIWWSRWWPLALCSGCHGFNSGSGNQISLTRLPWFPSVPADKCRYTILHCVTMAPFPMQITTH